VTLVGTVVNDVDVQPSTLTCQLRVSRIVLSDRREPPCRGLVYARLGRKADTANPDYGDMVEARGYLARPQPAYNPGRFDFAAYAARHGIFAEFNVRRSIHWRIVPASAAPGDLLPRLAAHFRSALFDTLSRLLPPAEAGLLAGVMLGTRVSLPPRINDDFQATGTGHILASSGMNVAIVAGMVLGLCRMGRVSRRIVVPITLAALAFYTLLAGAKPSIVRADLMASLLLCGHLLNREGDSPTALAAAALALLLVEPGHLFDPGFQLSFAVVAAIQAALPLGQAYWKQRFGGEAFAAARQKGRIHRLLTALAGGAMLTFVAQLAALPLLAQHFHLVPLVGFVANAFIVPLAASLMVLGFAVWFLSVVWPGIAPLLAPALLSPCLAYLVGAATVFAELPGAYVTGLDRGRSLLRGLRRADLAAVSVEGGKLVNW
jgi:competence protein ComEC